MDAMRFPSAETPAIEVADKRKIVDTLIEAVNKLESVAESGSRFVRQIVVRTEVLDPLHWIGKQTIDSSGDGEPTQTNRQLVYWSDRDGVERIAGIGIADEIAGDVFDTLDAVGDRALVSGNGESLRYFGGLRFDDRRELSSEWESFRGFRFILPRLEVEAFEAYTEVRCNVVFPLTDGERNAVVGELESITFSRQSWSGGSLRPVYRDDVPDEPGWTENIKWALDSFSRTRLGKIVLARRATFGFAEPIDAVALLERLSIATPSCYHFLFSGSDGSVFVGASPERLFKKQDRHIWSEAVAGTRPRGATVGDDDLLRDELLLSEKDQREHQFVRQSIKDTLAELCEDLELDGRPSEMRLARGRHLVSRVRGVLLPDVTTIDLLRALHPTPAVGGYPTPEAVRAIARLEPFDRGWYAAPIGWLSAKDAEFAVGIRSGLLSGKRLSLYSGAGIVGGSTPENEWAEIENKIVDFISVFDSD